MAPDDHRYLFLIDGHLFYAPNEEMATPVVLGQPSKGWLVEKANEQNLSIGKISKRTPRIQIVTLIVNALTKEKQANSEELPLAHSYSFSSVLPTAPEKIMHNSPSSCDTKIQKIPEMERQNHHPVPSSPHQHSIHNTTKKESTTCQGKFSETTAPKTTPFSPDKNSAGTAIAENSFADCSPTNQTSTSSNNDCHHENENDEFMHEDGGENGSYSNTCDRRLDSLGNKEHGSVKEEDEENGFPNIHSPPATPDRQSKLPRTEPQQSADVVEVIQFQKNGAPLNDIRGTTSTESAQQAKLSKCQQHNEAKMLRLTDSQFQSVGFDLLYRYTKLEILEGILKNYVNAPFYNIWDKERCSHSMFYLRENIDLGPLKGDRFRYQPAFHQLGFLSLRHDELYIDRVFYLLHHLSDPERRKKIWLKLVVMHLPMTSQIKEFRNKCISGAIYHPREFSREELNILKCHNPTPQDSPISSDAIATPLLLKVYRVTESVPAMILSHLDVFAHHQRFSPQYHLLATSTDNTHSETLSSKCPLILLKHTRWSGHTDDRWQITTIDLILPPPYRDSKLTTPWHSGFPVNKEGHYLPFYEANPYYSFPHLSDLNLQAQHMVPLSPLRNFRSVSSPHYTSTIADSHLHHNMWVERAFLESYLQDSYQTKLDSIHWRQLCEQTYLCVTANLDSVRDGLSIHALEVFNDPNQISTIVSRLQILSQLFHVRVVLIKMIDGTSGTALLQVPTHPGVSPSPLLRTIVIGFEEGNYEENSHKFYSAKYYPGNPLPYEPVPSDLPQISEQGLSFDSIVPFSSAEVAPTCYADVDSVFLASDSMTLFGNAFLYDGDPPKLCESGASTTHLLRKARPNFSPQKTTNRYRVPIYGKDPHQSSCGSYTLHPDFERGYTKQILCPLMCFPTLHIGKTTIHGRGIEFSLSITLIDTESLDNHHELKPKLAYERGWTPRDCESWHEIVSLAIKLWRSNYHNQVDLGLSAKYAEPPNLPSRNKKITLVDHAMNNFFAALHEVCQQLRTGQPCREEESPRLARLLLTKSVFLASAAGIKAQVQIGHFAPGGNGNNIWDGESLFLNQSNAVMEQAKREVLASIIPNPSACSVIGMDIGHTTFMDSGNFDLFVMHDGGQSKKIVDEYLERNAAAARNYAPPTPPSVHSTVASLFDFFQNKESTVTKFLLGTAVKVAPKGFAVGHIVDISRGNEPDTYSVGVRFLIGNYLPAQFFPTKCLFWSDPPVDQWTRCILLNAHDVGTNFGLVWSCLHNNLPYICKDPSTRECLTPIEPPHFTIPVGFSTGVNDQYNWSPPWEETFPDIEAPPSPTPSSSNFSQAKGSPTHHDPPPERSDIDQSHEHGQPYLTPPDVQNSIPGDAGSSPTQSFTNLHESGSGTRSLLQNSHPTVGVTFSINSTTDNTLFELEDNPNNRPITLFLEQVPGDGNCFFSSVWHHATNYPDATAIRMAVVEFIKSDDERFAYYFDFYSPEDLGFQPEIQYSARANPTSNLQMLFEDYLVYVSQSSTYVAHVIMQATADMLQRTLVVYNGADGTTYNISPRSVHPENPNRTPIPLYFNGRTTGNEGHYDALTYARHSSPLRLKGGGRSSQSSNCSTSSVNASDTSESGDQMSVELSDGSSVIDLGGHNDLYSFRQDPGYVSESEYSPSDDDQSAHHTVAQPTRSSRNQPAVNQSQADGFQREKPKVSRWPYLHNRNTCGYSTPANFVFEFAKPPPNTSDAPQSLRLICPFHGLTGIAVYNPTAKFAEKHLIANWSNIKHLPNFLFRLSQLHTVSDDDRLQTLCTDFCQSIDCLQNVLPEYWDDLRGVHSVRVETNWMFDPKHELPSLYCPLPALSISKPCVKGQLVNYSRAKIDSHMFPLRTVQREIQRHLSLIVSTKNTVSRKSKLTHLRQALLEIDGDILATLLLHSDACATLLQTRTTYVPPRSSATYQLWKKGGTELAVDNELIRATTPTASSLGLSYLIPASLVLQGQEDGSTGDAPNPLFLDKLSSVQNSRRFTTNKQKSTAVRNATSDQSLRELSLICRQYVQQNHQRITPIIEDCLADCIISATTTDASTRLSSWLVTMFSLCIKLYFDELHTKLAYLTGCSKDTFAECCSIDDLKIDAFRAASESVCVSYGNEFADDEVRSFFGHSHRKSYFLRPEDISLLPRTLFGATDLTNEIPFIKGEIWSGRTQSKPSTVVLQKVIHILSDVRKFLERKKQQHLIGVLCPESLLYHFLTAFRNQPHQYAVFHPHKRYVSKKCLIVQCDIIAIPGFEGSDNELSHLMTQYRQGFPSAVLPGQHQAMYNNTPLWIPIACSTIQRRNTLHDKFSTVAGCCNMVKDPDNGQWTYPNGQNLPTSFQIFLHKYLNHIKVDADQEIDQKCLHQPMAEGTNLTLSELYRNLPSKSVLRKSYDRWEKRLHLLGIKVHWPANPSSDKVAEAEESLKDHHKFWSILHSSVTPKVAQAWRFSRLHYEATYDPPPPLLGEDLKEWQRDWSRKCARQAIAAIFPSVPRNIQGGRNRHSLVPDDISESPSQASSP